MRHSLSYRGRLESSNAEVAIPGAAFIASIAYSAYLIQKLVIRNRPSLLLSQIDLHHDGFLAEVIGPFNDLPAKFVVEPLG
jgi:hypothetical protein